MLEDLEQGLQGKELQAFLKSLDKQQKKMLVELLGELQVRAKYNVLESIFPEEGPFRRELYEKHIQYLNAGRDYEERCFMAANRVGKSFVNNYECVLHATKAYPDWWEGRRFEGPINLWMGGDTGKTVRDIIQPVLLGSLYDMGTGFIPKDYLMDDSGNARVRNKAGLPGAIEKIYVRDDEYNFSEITLKSYEQGREGWQGTKIHYIGLDEECDEVIYSEANTRTMVCDGIMSLTFTPLRGISNVVLSFLPNLQYPKTDNLCGPVTIDNEGKEIEEPFKWFSTCTWEDVPHISERERKRQLAGYQAHEKEARSKGIPSVGAAKVYPVLESEIVITPVEIPDHWLRGYAIDPGWNQTAAIWFAYDEREDVFYLTDEYKVTEKQPIEHGAVFARKAKGWMTGVIDPAGKGLRMTKGSKSMLDEYRDMGLELYMANNDVEAGVLTLLNRMTTGRFKVFSTCQRWLEEFRLYRRNETGKVHKDRRKSMDDLLDATRYAVMSGLRYAEPTPSGDGDYDPDKELERMIKERSRNRITGY